MLYMFHKDVKASEASPYLADAMTVEGRTRKVEHAQENKQEGLQNRKLRRACETRVLAMVLCNTLN
jgi:hypothetical protein